MTRLTRHAPFLAIGVALIAAAIVATAAQAGPIAKTPVAKLAPPIACTMANRMDIFIDEDSILWECECSALKSGHICRWTMVAGVDAVNTRKRIKARLHVRVLPILIVVAHA